jgi:hypothetical protein
MIPFPFILNLFAVYFKFKLQPLQRGFVKSKPTVTNLITHLHTVAPIVCSQVQVDSIYFDLR